MRSSINWLIQHLTKNPKSLFLLDGIGALATACSLFCITTFFHEHFPLPKPLFKYLLVTASFYGIYSITCFLLLKNNWPLFIRLIATANLLYGSLIIAILIQYLALMKIISMGYFFVEIAMIFGITFVEFKVARKIEKGLLENGS